MHTQPSIEQVIASYTQTVYGVALTHTTSRADADDVFQEVFTAYWRSKPQISSEEHRKAWLIRTAINFSLKTTQSSWAQKTVLVNGERDQGFEKGEMPKRESGGVSELGKTGVLDLENWDGAATEVPPADFTFQTEQQSALYEAIGKLPKAYRTVVLLFYFEDLSIAQIADVLSEEQGAVKTRLSRARSQLREKLKEGARDD